MTLKSSHLLCSSSTTFRGRYRHEVPPFVPSSSSTYRRNCLPTKIAKGKLSHQAARVQSHGARLRRDHPDTQNASATGSTTSTTPQTRTVLPGKKAGPTACHGPRIGSSSVHRSSTSAIQSSCAKDACSHGSHSPALRHQPSQSSLGNESTASSNVDSIPTCI